MRSAVHRTGRSGPKRWLTAPETSAGSALRAGFRALARLITGIAVVGLSVVSLAGADPYRDAVAQVPIPRPHPKVTTVRRDVVVYGATASGVMAAIAAKEAGASVALVEPTSTVGGMVVSGISATDIGRKSSIGGLPLQLYQRAADEYGLRRFGVSTAWKVEAHVAARIIAKMLSDAGVDVYRGQRLTRPGGVMKLGDQIMALRMDSGARFEGSVFVDSTYEGDLLAEAGARFTVGREATTKYGESLAGVRPSTTVRPKVSAALHSDPSRVIQPLGPPPGPVGSADERIQPYNFRLCLTRDPANRVTFRRPVGYDRGRYVLLQRILDKLVTRPSGVQLDDILSLASIPNGKVDANAFGVASFDLIGGSWKYPNATYRERVEIWRRHFTYQAGLLFYLANDEAVPASVRLEAQQWGLCRDEWADTDHWPPLLYVREARRLVGDFVLTESDVLSGLAQGDSVGLASYRIDAHAAGLFAGVDGLVSVEGALAARFDGTYQIPYRVMLPRPDDVSNLLVTVAVSASHVAYASLRMEPHFMVMGEAAGVAAALALEQGAPVASVDVSTLQARLVERGAILRSPAGP